MSNEFKPCPCCGKINRVILYSTFCYADEKISNIRFGVKCNKCGIEIGMFRKKEIAIKRWNTRPAEDDLRAEVESLKEALRGMRELWDALGGQVPPVLGEQKYIRAKNLLNAPCTNKESDGKDE